MVMTSSNEDLLIAEAHDADLLVLWMLQKSAVRCVSRLIFRERSDHLSRSIRKMSATAETSCLLDSRKYYVIQFAQEHVEFRVPELRSLCRLFRIPLNEQALRVSKSPFLLLPLAGDGQARDLVRRSVLIRSCFEFWAEADDFSKLLHKLQHLPGDFVSNHINPETSFRLRVHAYGKKLRLDEMKRKIDDLGVLPFSGPVDLVDPECSLHLLEDYGNPAARLDGSPHLYFGRWIADSAREVINRFRLDERYFIGTTSMDPLLALVMANQALVAPGDLVYDPFVGTGSLLVAAAHFGGYVMGGDIDQTLLHGRGKSTRAKNTWRRRDESVLSNFKQYSLDSQYCDVLVADATRSILRPDVFFDAIIADPPYGVREATAQVRKSRPTTLDEETPASDRRIELGKCHLNDLIVTLVDFAARHLRLGGRLVYWLPAVKDEYDESAIPRHECLEMFSNSEQRLSGMTSRRLITMEKTREWKPEYRVTFADVYSGTFREKYFTARRNNNGRQKHSVMKDDESVRVSGRS